MAVPSITAAVLAGGRSRRLGRDKASLPLGGRPLAHWVAAAVSPLAAECWLVTNQPLEHPSLGWPCLIDLWPGRGALGGLLSTMLVARGAWILLAACDAPFLQPALLEAMIQKIRAGRPDAVVCQSSRHLEPLPGLFSVRLLARLEAQIQVGAMPIRKLLAACRSTILAPAEIQRHDPQELSFLNINTPQDWAAAQALLAAAAPLPTFPA